LLLVVVFIGMADRDAIGATRWLRKPKPKAQIVKFEVWYLGTEGGGHSSLVSMDLIYERTGRPVTAGNNIPAEYRGPNKYRAWKLHFENKGKREWTYHRMRENTVWVELKDGKLFHDLPCTDVLLAVAMKSQEHPEPHEYMRFDRDTIYPGQSRGRWVILPFECDPHSVKRVWVYVSGNSLLTKGPEGATPMVRGEGQDPKYRPPKRR